LDAAQYEFLDCIGEGATSEVWYCRCRTTNQELAIKKVDLDRSDTDIETFHKEVTFWSHASHANVVAYYGSFLAGPILHIAMEFMAGGSIASFLKGTTGFSDETLIATILKGVTSALAYLERNEQVHRDIKPANILVSSQGSIKIGDFGVAAELSSGGRRRSRYTVIGTPCYMAPEIFDESGTGYTEKADIWSLGITAIELAIGVAPRSELAPLAVIEGILKGPVPGLSRDRAFSTEFHHFVDSCLQKDPNRRMPASQLLLTPFIQKAKDDAYIFSSILKDVPPLTQRVQAGNEIQEKIIARLAGEIVPPQWNFGEITAPTAPPEPKCAPQPKSVDPVRLSDSGPDKASRFKITRQKVESSDPPQPDDRPQDPIASLARRVEVLESENAKLTQIVNDLQRRIAELESHQ
jgi:serine/threonine-protein kinase OSR1/STK39